MNHQTNRDNTALYYHRYNCRLCLSQDIRIAIPFAPTPVAEKYVKAPVASTPLFPVDLYMCANCGHVQILDVIDPEYLWSDYTYHSGQTPAIVRHFEDVSQRVLQKYGPFEGAFALDVGSNDGSLLKCFQKHGFRVLGIDPATAIARKACENGIETIADLMSYQKGQQIKTQYGPADLITAFNVFAHADEMQDLLKGIVEVLHPQGLFVFEVSYLKDIIDRMLIGTIFHEHLCNHSLAPLKLFLEAAGLEIIEVEHVSIQGGSLIGYAQHRGGPRALSPSVGAMLQDEQQAQLHEFATMQHFVNRFAAMRQQVHQILANYQQGQTIAAYGAARSGPMLVTQFDLKDMICEVYDDHPQKVGLYTPGDNFQVRATAALYERKPDVVVILAWVHAKSIVRKHVDYIEQGGRFLTLTPDVKLIDSSNYAQFIQ